jgi:hypothetical protein
MGMEPGKRESMYYIDFEAPFRVGKVGGEETLYVTSEDVAIDQRQGYMRASFDSPFVIVLTHWEWKGGERGTKRESKRITVLVSRDSDHPAELTGWRLAATGRGVYSLALGVDD